MRAAAMLESEVMTLHEARLPDVHAYLR